MIVQTQWSEHGWALACDDAWVSDTTDVVIGRCSFPVSLATVASVVADRAFERNVELSDQEQKRLARIIMARVHGHIAWFDTEGKPTVRIIHFGDMLREAHPGSCVCCTRRGKPVSVDGLCLICDTWPTEKTLPRHLAVTDRDSFIY